jgi:hypothetical protein
MKKDPIIEEVRKAGENLARTAGYDVHAFFNLLREKEKQHADRLFMRNPPTYADSSSGDGFVICSENKAEYKNTD